PYPSLFRSGVVVGAAVLVLEAVEILRDRRASIVLVVDAVAVGVDALFVGARVVLAALEAEGQRDAELEELRVVAHGLAVRLEDPPIAHDRPDVDLAMHAEVPADAEVEHGAHEVTGEADARVHVEGRAADEALVLDRD